MEGLNLEQDPVSLGKFEQCVLHKRTMLLPILERRTKSHEQQFVACELGIADEGDYCRRWNQLLCYPSVSCDVNSLHHVTSITPNIMADNNMLFRQRAVIEFLVKEEIPAAEIHQILQHAY